MSYEKRWKEILKNRNNIVGHMIFTHNEKGEAFFGKVKNFENENGALEIKCEEFQLHKDEISRLESIAVDPIGIDSDGNIIFNDKEIGAGTIYNEDPGIEIPVQFQ